MIELSGRPAPAGPRPVFCMIAEAHCDRAIAEAVCAGRFTHCGVTLELGLDPNWLGDGLPADEEWRIEWSKFLYGLDLANAFAETSERRFLTAWERLVRSWLEQVPVGADATEVAARRIQNWIYAWQAFAAAPSFGGLTSGLPELLLTRIGDETAHVRDHLTPERNHRTLELYALLLVTLAFPELDPGAALLELARVELHRNLLTDIRPDGVHREASTHYHMLALRSFLGALAAGRPYGLHFDPSYEERLEQACEFALHCHRPDGAIPALSDSDSGSHLDLLALAASLFDRPDFLYAATSGQRGTVPATRLAAFPDSGYYVQRSGWGERATPFADERYLVFDCGPLGDGGHGHYDLLSVEVAAGGRGLIVDPGRYTYAEAEPNLRRRFKATAAHNTVTVDGLDQTPYRRGKPKEPIAEGRFLGRTSLSGLDVLRAEVRSGCYDAVHTRTVAFVAGEYWLVEDRLHGESQHRYDLRFQLGSEAWRRCRLDANRQILHAPGFALVVVGAGTLALEESWIAPEYGIKQRAPAVSAMVDGRDAVFTTLIAPIDDREPVPRLRVRRPNPDETDVVVESDATRDHISWTGATADWQREGFA